MGPFRGGKKPGWQMRDRSNVGIENSDLLHATELRVARRGSRRSRRDKMK